MTKPSYPLRMPQIPWRVPMPNTTLSEGPMFDVAVCDFCCSPNIIWVYPAKSFPFIVAGVALYTSQDEWAVCELCDEAIENHGIEGTLKRSLETCFSYISPDDTMFAIALRDFHQKFFDNRTGPAYRYDPATFGKDKS